MGRTKRKSYFTFEVPEGHVQDAEVTEQWKRLWRRHLAAGKRLCALSQLVHEVFFSELWRGGQTSWRSEAEVLR